MVATKRNYPWIKKLARLMIIVGIIWVLSFPQMSKKIYVSENALEVMSDRFFLLDSFYANYRQVQDKVT